MARVTVHVYANLRQHVQGAASIDVDLLPGDTVQQILQRLQIPPGTVQIALVNHRAVGLEHALESDARIDLFSPIGGG